MATDESAEPDQFHRFLLRHFGEPHGWSGRCVGRLLAWTNAEVNRRAVERLGLTPTSRVLEVGFGPGIGIKLLVERLPGGLVAGLDPSDVMIDQARARNRVAVASGRADLRQGTAAALPWPDRSFDAVLTLNSLLLWEPLPRSLEEVYRVLRPGGEFLVGFHEVAARAQAPRARGALAPDLAELARRLRAWIESARFVSVRSEVVRLRWGRGLFVTATRPDL